MSSRSFRSVSHAICALLVLMIYRVDAGDARSNKAELAKKLDSIVFPKLEFKDLTIEESLNQIRAMTKDYSLEGEPINLVVQAAPATLKQKINLSVSDVPLGSAIYYVTMGTDIGYKVEPYAILVSDKLKESEKMETRVYQVHPSFMKGAINKDKERLEFETNR